MKLHSFLPQPLQSTLKGLYEAKHCYVRAREAKRMLIREAVRLSSQCLDDVNTLTDWKEQRPKRREQLAWMLGLLPWKTPTDICAEITGKAETIRFTLEKFVYQSLPGLHVTANFYLPHKPRGPLPCVVYLNGHWPSPDGAKVGYQDRYLWYPANGFALLVIDPMGFGEIPGVHPGTNRLNLWHWLSLGYTPAGVEVWNAMRALDWIETRPEVDSLRIGATGISGGGVMAQFLASLDERVAAVAASCSTYTIGTQVAQNLVPEQCDCTFYPNVFRMDFPEVLALIAPRPLLILGGRKDPIFPPLGFREAFRRTKRIYDLYDEGGRSNPRIRLVESRHGHTDPSSFLVETRKWICRWLGSGGGTEPALEGPDPPPERPETLGCTKGIPTSALNYHIHDTWIVRPELSLPMTREAWSMRKDAILSTLRTRVFAWFPQQDIPYNTKRLIASGGYVGEWADYAEYEFNTEQGVPVHISLMIPRVQQEKAPLLIWIKTALDHVAFPDLDEFLPLIRSHALLILTPRFADCPLSGKDYATIERTAALLGRTIMAMQVWDVLRVIQWVFHEKFPTNGSVSVYGRGNAGIAGLYASILNQDITHVILRAPPLSHWQGPALITLLRDTDLCEVAGLLAPRRLTFLKEMPQCYEWTRHVYGIIGANEHCLVQPTVAEAVFAATLTQREHAP